MLAVYRAAWRHIEPCLLRSHSPRNEIAAPCRAAFSFDFDNRNQLPDLLSILMP
jgi:hypothetical protein